VIFLKVKDTTDSPNSASYLDLYPEHDINGSSTNKLYDKRDDFNFPFSRIKSRHILHPVISWIWCLHVTFDSIFEIL